MPKKNKKALDRQAKALMKGFGLEIPQKKAVGGLNYSSKGKKANPNTNSKISKRVNKSRKFDNSILLD